jgi:hypothetical protein
MELRAFDWNHVLKGCPRSVPKRVPCLRRGHAQTGVLRPDGPAGSPAERGPKVPEALQHCAADSLRADDHVAARPRGLQQTLTSAAEYQPDAAR